VKVVNDSGTNVVELSDNKIINYPNPVHDSFYIQNGGNQVIDKVQLFDMNGNSLR
jgi:hypothetical protein